MNKTLKNGLELSKIAHSSWRITHKESGVFEEFCSQKSARHVSKRLSGDIGYYVSELNNGIVIKTGLMGCGYEEVFATESEAITNYKEEKLTFLRNQMEQISVEIENIEKY